MKLELPLLTLPGAHPCSNCGECCTYVATQIDDPSNFQDYENVHWYLTHENVSVYIDWEGDWFIEFKTKCKHLSDAKTCGIYETRPRVCSEFSFNECERNSGEKAWKHYFESQEQFVEFLRAKRPRSYERYMKKRRELIRKRGSSREARAVPSRVSKRQSRAQ